MKRYSIIAQLEEQRKCFDEAKSATLQSYHRSRIEALEEKVYQFEEAAQDLSPLCQEIFRYRVLHNMTWEEIGIEVGYSRDSIFRLRRKYVQHFYEKGIIL